VPGGVSGNGEPPGRSRAAAGQALSGMWMPAAFLQMGPKSQLIAALNAVEEAPPGVSWLS
jgi:hypothetical protein